MEKVKLSKGCSVGSAEFSATDARRSSGRYEVF
ncbi:hypothetical protein FHS90_000483 [Rufibacter quisquiliarum]|uniref:Uncharacterized protein n=1 Tax=Rufibacter quisquiliarum TaxID=1549639 RepID=A0A839GLD6_9BACT|nr:hypothetical protein [Rufibacter quisquiliarum]